jgi:hypothetical protein
LSELTLSPITLAEMVSGSASPILLPAQPRGPSKIVSWLAPVHDAVEELSVVSFRDRFSRFAYKVDVQVGSF